MAGQSRRKEVRMAPIARAGRRVRTRRGALALLIGGALAAAILVQSVSARPQVAPTNTAAPTITGTPTVGQTLTASQGTWANSPTSFAYQWVRCPASGGLPDGSDCAALSGATTRAYVLAAGDVGFRLRVRVTATNADGSATAASGATDTVRQPEEPVSTGCPNDRSTRPIPVSQVSLPAGQLRIDRQQIIPPVVTRDTQAIRVRIHISACGGRSIGGALVYVTPTPYQQFSDLEQPTQADGWATLTLTRERFFPASGQQQNLVVFVRARKPDEDLLGGVSARRLVSFRVDL
jgi:hypothetical protein